MEIVVSDLSFSNLKDLNFIVPDREIVGITGNGKSTVLKLLNGVIIGSGNIKYGGKKITSKNRLEIVKQIGYIDSNFHNSFLSHTVLEYMLFFIQYYKLSIRDPEKKISDSLKIVGLNNTYMNRSITSLSSSEKKLLEIATSLLTNPKILLMDEPFLNLDDKNEKRLGRLLDQLNDKFCITIVIASSNSEILYKYTKRVVFLSDDTVLFEGNTKEVYSEVDKLEKKGFEIPDIVRFTYLAKTKKNVQIDYHRDIRDLIKDIYKHV